MQDFNASRETLRGHNVLFPAGEGEGEAQPLSLEVPLANRDTARSISSLRKINCQEALLPSCCNDERTSACSQLLSACQWTRLPDIFATRDDKLASQWERFRCCKRTCEGSNRRLGLLWARPRKWCPAQASSPVPASPDYRCRLWTIRKYRLCPRREETLVQEMAAETILDCPAGRPLDCHSHPLRGVQG